MISPNQLTKENGFEDGVVVWVNDRIFQYKGIFKDWRDFEQRSAFVGESPWVYIDDVESIKVLSGPMAIWNFAPKDAEVCVKTEWEYIFFNEYDWSLNESFPKDGESVAVKPFWAKETK